MKNLRFKARNKANQNEDRNRILNLKNIDLQHEVQNL